MSTAKSVAAVAMAALLVLAGCAGPATQSGDGSAPADATTPATGSVDGGTGTVEFYVSDEENAIQDFEHLNVTITKVGLHRAGAEGDDGEDERETNETDEEATDDEEATETNETATPANATATATSGEETNETDEADEEDEADEADEEEEAEDEQGEGGEEESEGDDERAGWVEYEVNRTVDLTELRGANATKLGTLAAPNGSYDKVFVHVGSIEGTLENGEQVNVKLPSEKLQIKKGFTVGNGQNVSFVFDITVFEAGNNGKYILKPVISQSGTGDEVDIEDVDEEDEKKEDEESEDDEENEDSEDDEANETDDADAAELSAEFQGPVEPGTDATVKVTGEEGPVAGATVTVNDEEIGTTDESGTVTFAVPEDAEELEVKVEKGDAEAELEREFESEGLLRAPA